MDLVRKPAELTGHTCAQVQAQLRFSLLGTHSASELHPEPLLFGFLAWLSCRKHSLPVLPPYLPTALRN